MKPPGASGGPAREASEDPFRQPENSKDVLIGGPGDDRLDGGNGKDDLYGGDGEDFLDGRNGPDRLFGGAADDVWYGSNSEDHLDGGPGHDECYGRGGSDTFVECQIEGTDIPATTTSLTTEPATTTSLTTEPTSCLLLTFDLPRAADNLVQSDLSRFDLTVHAEQALPDARVLSDSRVRGGGLGAARQRSG